MNWRPLILFLRDFAISSLLDCGSLAGRHSFPHSQPAPHQPESMISSRVFRTGLFSETPGFPPSLQLPGTSYASLRPARGGPYPQLAKGLRRGVSSSVRSRLTAGFRVCLRDRRTNELIFTVAQGFYIIKHEFKHETRRLTPQVCPSEQSSHLDTNPPLRFGH